MTQQQSQLHVLAQLRHLPAGRGGFRHGHLVEEEITHEAEGTLDRRRSFGCAGRRSSGGRIRNRPPRPLSRPPIPSTKLLTIPDDQFQEIRIKKLTGESQDLKRVNGKWRIIEPKALPADQDAVSSMVSSLSSLTADKTIEDKATDLKSYGLNDPTLDITVTKKDGKTDGVAGRRRHPHEFRQSTPSCPAARKSTPSPASSRPASTRRLNDLRDKRLLTFDSDKLTRVRACRQRRARRVRQERPERVADPETAPAARRRHPGGFARQQAQGRQDGSRRHPKTTPKRPPPHSLPAPRSPPPR